MRCFPEKSIIT